MGVGDVISIMTIHRSPQSHRYRMFTVFIYEICFSIKSSVFLSRLFDYKKNNN